MSRSKGKEAEESLDESGCFMSSNVMLQVEEKIISRIDDLMKKYLDVHQQEVHQEVKEEKTKQKQTKSVKSQSSSPPPQPSSINPFTSSFQAPVASSYYQQLPHHTPPFTYQPSLSTCQQPQHHQPHHPYYHQPQPQPNYSSQYPANPAYYQSPLSSCQPYHTPYYPPPYQQGTHLHMAGQHQAIYQAPIMQPPSPPFAYHYQTPPTVSYQFQPPSHPQTQALPLTGYQQLPHLPPPPPTSR